MEYQRYPITASLLALIVLACVPVFFVRVPPLVDYPNHLARMHLLANIDASPVLQQYYEIRWAVLPNLAMDVIVPPLSRVMPIYAAGKVFILLTFLLLVTGTAALHRVLHGKLAYWPMLSVFFLYNRAFLWGFLNFLFGIGVMLWLLAAWITCRDKSPAFRICLFFALSLLLFLSHLFAFGVYGLCIVGYTFYRFREERSGNGAAEWGIALAQFVLPVVLFLFFCPTAEAAASHAVRFGGLSRKVGALLQPVNNYHRVFDAFTFLVLFGGIAVGLITKSLAVSKPIRYPLLLLTLFFVMMPQHLLSVQAVDSRIPTPFAFLLVAGTRPAWESLSRGRIILLSIGAALFGCLLLGRIGVITHHWRNADRLYDEVQSALTTVETGSKLFSAAAFSGSWQPFPIPVSHFACVAVIDRFAFVPSLFAFETQQPIRFSDAVRHLQQTTPPAMFPAGRAPDWAMIAAHYDYVLLFNESAFDQGFPSEYGRTIHAGDGFRLARTRSAKVKTFATR